MAVGVFDQLTLLPMRLPARPMPRFSRPISGLSGHILAVLIPECGA